MKSVKGDHSGQFDNLPKMLHHIISSKNAFAA